MKREMRKIMLLAVLFGTVAVVAKENVDTEERRTIRDGQLTTKMKFGSDCDPATQSADLDINNVRTKILNGGDMWWDLNNAKYEIPKLPSETNEVRKHSLFSGAIWIGGEDNGTLKLAAMTYRQRGSDFWPGPLDPATANTSKSECSKWDDIYKVNGETIIDHVNNFTGNVDQSIAEWPGDYAPFKDVDGDGTYNPQVGDYPILQNECKGVVQTNAPEDQPDQMLWWIYNDKGNIHSETQGEAIGIEMQTTAFAFSTNDEINDMTFYTTRLINRGFNNLENTYFGQWVDADLGNYSDDYVGCDVGLSLGFCYNGDDNDEGILGYGLNPPSVGVDFFEGPTITLDDGTQQELGMSKFVYYNNNANSINGNPFIATDFYNYLSGKWRTGTEIQFGGDGITGTDGTKADYMFPFDTDPNHPGKNWNEKEAGNSPADRRFIQSSGPFVLEPGAVQRLTVGVVWARTNFGGADGSLRLLKQASRKAQDLFNSCFDLIDGPDAPEVEVHEQDRQIVLSFGDTDNERVELYSDSIFNDAGQAISYQFQGYRVYQLKNASVSLSDLDDQSLAREVFQCDYNDELVDLFEEEYDVDVDEDVLKLRVRAENKGLRHTVKITEDQFATGSDKTLVNFKTYDYIVLSYAAADAARDLYLEGRKVQKFSAVPHNLEPKFSGSGVPSFYGDGPELEVIEGKGNGNNELELKEEVVADILANNKASKLIYENGMGPVNVSVVDPLKVPLGQFELSMIPKATGSEGSDDDSLAADGTTWVLVKLGDGTTANDTVFADTSINYSNEQVILESTTGKAIQDWGLAVTIEQVAAPGTNSQEIDDNGFINWSVDFSDASNEWLTAVTDVDASTATQFGVFDWIRSGPQGQSTGFNDPSWHDHSSSQGALDRNGVYEKIWDGRIAPNRLVSNTSSQSDNAAERPYEFVQPFTYGFSAMQGLGLENLSNVDLVITPDETKWSECVMIEMGEDPALNEDGVEKFQMRSGTLTYKGQTLPRGMTIFPGYAIDVNTGERLNIMVGEDSRQRGENGRDMKWNPTDNAGFISGNYAQFGGRHFIYVMGSHTGLAASRHPKGPIYGGTFPGAADGGNTTVEGKNYQEIFSSITPTTSNSQKIQLMTYVYQNCDWVIPSYMALGKIMKENEDGIPVPPNEMRIRLRVDKPYGKTAAIENAGLPKYKFGTEDIYNDISVDNGIAALETANIVPNPYYAYSGYEGSPIDNRVKFTNLPEKVQISIYTLDGSLVRRIDKDDETTYVDWNLKNNAGVPVASGMYIIHIDAGELGEKILKWMGVMRELDLDSF